MKRLVSPHVEHCSAYSFSGLTTRSCEPAQDAANCVSANYAVVTQVKDLLSVGGKKQNLKVRNHKVMGPYVEGCVLRLCCSCAHPVRPLFHYSRDSGTQLARYFHMWYFYNCESRASFGGTYLFICVLCVPVQAHKTSCGWIRLDRNIDERR